MNGCLAPLAAEKRLVLLLGEGGVGKTTCAAALATWCALRGRRAAVLTIDPAPRLGTALGVGSLEENPRDVELPEAVREGGSLHAFRLDTKRTFDRIVEKLAPNRENASAILAHPIYRALSSTLGGSDVYMALQRLYEIDSEDEYDVLVVDTPPLTHAKELLAAPLRLSALIETDAARVLANPAIAIARAGSRLVRTSASLLLPLLERATGLALRTEVAQFIERFDGILRGLTERSSAVESLLRSDASGFVAVVRPSDDGVEALQTLRRTFAAHGLGIAAVVVNRLTPAAGRERALPLEERLAGAPEGTREAVAAMEADLDARRADEQRALARARAIVDADDGIPVAELDALEHDISDLGEIVSLGHALCDKQRSDSRTGTRTRRAASKRHETREG